MPFALPGRDRNHGKWNYAKKWRRTESRFYCSRDWVRHAPLQGCSHGNLSVMNFEKKT